MHFEILVEDQSGKKMLDCLIPKIIGEEHSFRVLSYKGIGNLPKNMKNPKEASNRILLENLPKALRGFGKTYAAQGDNFKSAVIVVCDLDDKCLKQFRQQLIGLLDKCEPKPEARFCIAVEEGEAWLLGDINAIEQAYQNVKEQCLKNYVNDSICGTWEVLADAVYIGGSEKLSQKGWQAVGKEKSNWAENITPFMSIDDNKSPSFNYFKSKLIELTGSSENS
ncbi:MAG: hypothetical protein KA015_01630 [Spirochaetes bacterium]|nr:hypothetical protein [Spirochaetota bacterium]